MEESKDTQDSVVSSAVRDTVLRAIGNRLGICWGR